MELHVYNICAFLLHTSIKFNENLKNENTIHIFKDVFQSLYIHNYSTSKSYKLANQLFFCSPGLRKEANK